MNICGPGISFSGKGGGTPTPPTPPFVPIYSRLFGAAAYLSSASRRMASPTRNAIIFYTLKGNDDDSGAIPRNVSFVVNPNPSPDHTGDIDWDSFQPLVSTSDGGSTVTLALYIPAGHYYYVKDVDGGYLVERVLEEIVL